jgi:ammonia channel protein AmtB
MLIVFGFFGFLGGCIIFPGTAVSFDAVNWTNIYGMPTTLSAITFNTLMGVAGGIIGCYAMTRDPFWMMSGALCGIISVAAGMDVWDPSLCFAIAFAGGILGPWAAGVFERMGIDDAVGAVSVHGICGIWGVLAVGIFMGGYPQFSADIPVATFMGQFKGMIVMVLLGFIPGYVISWLFKMAGVLRASDAVQLAGMDVEVVGDAYPEEIKS